MGVYFFKSPFTSLCTSFSFETFERPEQSLPFPTLRQFRVGFKGSLGRNLQLEQLEQSVQLTMLEL